MEDPTRAVAPALEDLLSLMRDCLAWMEAAELRIEGEWGMGRSLAELEAAGGLSDEIIRLRAAIRSLAPGVPT